MRSDWKEYKLADIANYISLKRDMKNITLNNYISTENILPDKGGITISSKLPSVNKVNSFKIGDTLFSNIRTYFRKVWYSTFNGGVSNDVLVIRSRDINILDSKYLYYLLSNEKFIQYTVQTAKGTKMPRGDKTAIMNYSLFLPSLQTQKKIAHILSTLDNKIELNRKTDQTLEKMAQTIFKSWFIDFDPVKAKAKEGDSETIARELGISQEILELFPNEFVDSEMGLIPKGWEISTIEKEVSIFGGATPRTKESKYWKNGKNHWATPRDLSKLSTKILIDTDRKITEEGVKKISSKQLPIGTILLSSRAPVGYIAYSTVPISINQGFIAMVCNKRVSNYFIMYWLDVAMREIKGRSEGTTFAEISKKAFRPIKLIVPSQNTLLVFDNYIKPMVEKIILNEKEIKKLQKTRDTLLPKLLSGELNISKVNL